MVGQARKLFYLFGKRDIAYDGFMIRGIPQFPPCIRYLNVGCMLGLR